MGEHWLERAKFAKVVEDGLESLGCDEYGSAYMPEPLRFLVNERGGISAELFEVLPFYWGEDAREASRPNFRFLGCDGLPPLELRWYKYAPRAMTCSRDVSPEELAEVFAACAGHMRADHGFDAVSD